MQRRHLVQTGLACLGFGAVAWPAKALWDQTHPKALKGPVSVSVADEVAASAPAMAMMAVEEKPRLAKHAAGTRRAYLHNTHTGDLLNVVYYENGRYVPGALLEANHVLRDWRNNQQHFIHPHLFDLLHDLRAKLDVSTPFQILSGYRSPATNAMLHEHSEQVASKSQHLLGKALDITLAGVNLARLHAAALSLRAGGVGYYPESGFVHIDVGPLREWAGT